MSLTRWASRSLAALLWLPPAIASAQEAPAAQVRQVSLQYEVAPPCPGDVTFKSQVLARTGRLAFVDASTERLSVRIERVGSKYEGQVSAAFFATPGPGRIEANTCDEVVAGLALATALELDTEAVAPPAVFPARPPAPRRPRVRKRATRSSAFQVVALGGARSGLGRLASPELGLELGFISGGPSWLRLPPHLHLAAVVAVGETLQKPGLEVGIAEADVEVDACPLSADGRVTLAACVAVSGGARRAAANPGRTEWSPSLATGLAARVWVGLGPLMLGVRLSARFEMMREMYLYRPDRPAYTVPPGSLDARAMLGYRW